MSEIRLLIDTSERVGQLGLVNNGEIVRSATLDESRRHARDLTAQLATMLQLERVELPQLTAIHVSIGPGGFTGLRVGVTLAKTLAYATAVPLVAVPCFHAIAEECSAASLWVIADALQGEMYLQRFERREGVLAPLDELQIVPADDWLAWVNPAIVITGPGVTTFANRFPCGARVEPRSVTLRGLLAAGLRRAALTHESLLALEPLYLRGSSAEEKAKRIVGSPAHSTPPST